MPPFDRSEPLVLCHCDLAPHNLLLDENKRLFLVDFGLAGLWPESSEAACMRPWWDELLGPRWSSFVRVVTCGFRTWRRALWLEHTAYAEAHTRGNTREELRRVYDASSAAPSEESL